MSQIKIGASVWWAYVLYPMYCECIYNFYMKSEKKVYGMSQC